MYGVHEFAELAGVTPKALYHYDRLGLLKPRRSAAGYRLYQERDLERLEQIVALRFLGIPLREIKGLLDRDALRLPEALRAQKSVLEEKRRRLDIAIAAIERAQQQTSSEASAASRVLKEIIQAIEMQSQLHDSMDFMKNYYREEAWSNFRALHRGWPSREWLELFGEMQLSLDEDPASAHAQSLAARWRALRVKDSAGDAKLHSGLIRAWADRQYWPEEIQGRFAGLELDRISQFARDAFGAWRRQQFGEIAWSGEFDSFSAEERERFPLAVADLYFKIDAAVDLDPGSATGQALAARWLELVESRTGGMPGDQRRYEGFLEWRKTWPAEIDRRLATIETRSIFEFVVKALQN